MGMKLLNPKTVRPARRTRARVGSWLGGLLLLATVAGAATSGGDLSAGQRKLVIEQAYQNLTRFTEAGGHPVTFQISHLKSIDAAQFDQVRWAELASLPGGDMIDMIRDRKEMEGATVALSYQAKWTLDGEDFLATPDGQRLGELAMKQVLAEAARTKPDLAHVVAATRFEVVATLEGRSRRYTAAVLWISPTAGQDVRLMFVDRITQGVEEALRDREVTVVPPQLHREKVAGASCYASSTISRELRKEDADSWEHWLDGYHHMAASAQQKCTCYSDCSATCDVGWIERTCEDLGGDVLPPPPLPPMCHRMYPASNSSIGHTEDARVTGPSCGAGYICAMKSCVGCLCGLTVGVNMEGASASFNTSGGIPDWSTTANFSNLQCAKCTEVPPPPDPTGGTGPTGPRVDDPLGGGSTSGGGGGTLCCLRWGTKCVVGRGGQYICTIDTTRCVQPC